MKEDDYRARVMDLIAMKTRGEDYDRETLCFRLIVVTLALGLGSALVMCAT